MHRNRIANPPSVHRPAVPAVYRWFAAMTMLVCMAIPWPAWADAADQPSPSVNPNAGPSTWQNVAPHEPAWLFIRSSSTECQFADLFDTQRHTPHPLAMYDLAPPAGSVHHTLSLSHSRFDIVRPIHLPQQCASSLFLRAPPLG